MKHPVDASILKKVQQVLTMFFLILDLIRTWLGLGLGGLWTKGLGTGLDNYFLYLRHSADLVKNNILYSVVEVIAFTLILCYILVSVVRKRYSFR